MQALTKNPLADPYILGISSGASTGATLALLVAAYMIWADVIARVSVAPEEIPVGVITALAGVPFFLIMLKKSRYDFGRR